MNTTDKTKPATVGDNPEGKIAFIDGFDHYQPECGLTNYRIGSPARSTLRYPLSFPVQAWWRRLLRMDRPAQRVVIGFQFKGQKWHAVEASVVTPNGTDQLHVELTFLDGAPIMVNPNTNFVAHYDE